jgi:hypothetical protein
MLCPSSLTSGSLTSGKLVLIIFLSEIASRATFGETYTTLSWMLLKNTAPYL